MCKNTRLVYADHGNRMFIWNTEKIQVKYIDFLDDNYKFVKPWQQGEGTTIEEYTKDFLTPDNNFSHDTTDPEAQRMTQFVCGPVGDVLAWEMNHGNMTYIYYMNFNSKFDFSPILAYKEEDIWVFSIQIMGDRLMLAYAKDNRLIFKQLSLKVYVLANFITRNPKFNSNPKKESCLGDPQATQVSKERNAAGTETSNQIPSVTIQDCKYLLDIHELLKRKVAGESHHLDYADPNVQATYERCVNDTKVFNGLMSYIYKREPLDYDLQFNHFKNGKGVIIWNPYKFILLHHGNKVHLIWHHDDQPGSRRDCCDRNNPETPQLFEMRYVMGLSPQNDYMIV